MTNKIITYEQPLNEQIRVCLRLEYLFEKADYFILLDSNWDLRQILDTILEILHIADRPDLKNKFGQVLNQYTASLIQLENLPDINKEKLHSILKQIDQLVCELRSNAKKPGQELRENDFLMAIQQRLHTPAGACNFSLPSYHLWLQQDKAIIKQQMSKWLSTFQQLRTITNLILDITRNSGSFKITKAIGGFYQSNLEPNIQHQMIRTNIELKKHLFPEISVGRHRLAIHFFTMDINGRVAQTPHDIDFELACCKL